MLQAQRIFSEPLPGLGTFQGNKGEASPKVAFPAADHIDTGALSHPMPRKNNLQKNEHPGSYDCREALDVTISSLLSKSGDRENFRGNVGELTDLGANVGGGIETQIS